MDRETRKIVLPKSGCEVEIITFLTWGENEKVQNIMMGGAKLENVQSGEVGFDAGVMLKSKYALLEIAVKGIKCGEEVKQYSKDWMDNLSVEDGEFLYNEIDEAGKKKS